MMASLSLSVSLLFLSFTSSRTVWLNVHLFNIKSLQFSHSSVRGHQCEMAAPEIEVA